MSDIALFIVQMLILLRTIKYFSIVISKQLEFVENERLDSFLHILNAVESIVKTLMSFLWIISSDEGIAIGAFLLFIFVIKRFLKSPLLCEMSLSEPTEQLISDFEQSLKESFPYLGACLLLCEYGIVIYGILVFLLTVCRTIEKLPEEFRETHIISFVYEFFTVIVELIIWITTEISAN